MWSVSKMALVLSSSLALLVQRSCGDGCGPVELAEIKPSDAVGFGVSIAVDGDVAAIGAYQATVAGFVSCGAVFVYRDLSGTWALEVRIENPDPASYDQFGSSVDVRGTRMLIGANRDTGNATTTGSVYVYEHDGRAWVKKARLIASDGATGDYFSTRVVLLEDEAIVSAPYDDDFGTDSGSIYVFNSDGVGWTQAQKLHALDATAGDLFGLGLGGAHDSLFAGAINDDDVGTNTGSVYWFERNGGFSQQAKFLASDAKKGAWFGSPIDFDDSGEVAVVGARGDTSLTGAAYVFARAGSTFIEIDKLTASDKDYDMLFGSGVAIDGKRIVVGSPGRDDYCYDHPDEYPCDDPDEVYSCDSGAAYVFEEESGTWTERHKIIPADNECEDSFGSGCKVVESVGLVAAFGEGSVYVYDLGAARIESVIPDHGPFRGGNTVVIEGCGFKSDMRVYFGGSEATSVTFVSATRIEAVAPPFNPFGNPFRWNLQASRGLSVSVDLKLESSSETIFVADAYEYRPALVV